MQSFFVHNGKTIHFEVIKRKRKTLEIQIKSTGKVIVLAPENSSQNQILQMLTKNANWISRKLAYYQARSYEQQEKTFSSGESFLFEGRPYQLQIKECVTAGKIIINKKEDQLLLSTSMHDETQIRLALVKWYKECCLEHVKERVEYYVPIIKRTPSLVKVKEQKKRWGTCTSSGHLYFNWTLMGAPPAVLDYVVLHEMCHLVHLNHSKEFWRILSSIMPDYKVQQEWLRLNGDAIRF